MLIVKFKDNKRKSNLKDGFLYQKFLTKIPEVMLLKWNRKTDKEEEEPEGVESLRDWCQHEVFI